MSDEGYVFEWPLWGLQLDTATAAPDEEFIVDGTLLYQPTWQQWSDMENGDVIEEHAGREVAAERLGMQTYSRPPICMLRLSSIDDSGEADPTLIEQEEQAHALVAAFRLYATGDFVNPDDVGIYMTYPNGFAVREVRAFRSAFYRYRPEHPYIVGIEDVEPLSGLAYWVSQCSTDRSHSNAALAIENFCLSFAQVTSWAERGLYCFIALEAMLGSVHGASASASFAVRAANAMNAQGDPAPDAPSWLERAGDLRNRLAHDIHAATLTQDDLTMLEAVTRGVLLSYLAYISLGEGPETEGRHPLRAFNKALAAGPIGDDT